MGQNIADADDSGKGLEPLNVRLEDYVVSPAREQLHTLESGVPKLLQVQVALDRFPNMGYEPP